MNYKYASFWTRIKDSINAVGTIAQVVLIAGDSEHIWNYLTGGIQLLGTFISIWFDDRDKDGKVDVFQKEFQKEVITTVTSDTPIKVETEVKKNENSAHGFTEGAELK